MKTTNYTNSEIRTLTNLAKIMNKTATIEEIKNDLISSLTIRKTSEYKIAIINQINSVV